MKIILKSLMLFIIFGILYFMIESLMKSEIAHWGIYLLAGIISVLISIANRYFPWRMPLTLQCTIGMVIATITECIVGIVTNLWLGLNLWHYNILPFCWGQCSLIFCGIWFLLSGLCLIADDYINWKWISKEQPVYY